MKVTQNPNPHSLPLDKPLATERATEKSPLQPRGEGVPAEMGSRGGANVEISDTARMMNRAAEIAQSVPDVRHDKVAALKKSIQDGTYQVDSAAIAEKIVDEHLHGDFGKNHL